MAKKKIEKVEAKEAKPKVEKPVEKKSEKKQEEKLEKSSILSEEQTSGWEKLIDSDATSTLNQKITQTTPWLAPVKEKLEDALAEIPDSETDKKTKGPYDQKTSDSNSYIETSRTFNGTVETKSIEDLGNFNQVRTFNTMQQDTRQENVYDMKRNADETLNRNWGVEGVKKYQSTR